MATLWQISDNTTPGLMRSFYTGLAEQNLLKAAALQQAQIEMTSYPEISDPFFLGAVRPNGQLDVSFRHLLTVR